MQKTTLIKELNWLRNRRIIIHRHIAALKGKAGSSAEVEHYHQELIKNFARQDQINRILAETERQCSPA